MSDPTKKTIRQLIYFVPDHRATGQHALHGEGFYLDPEAGESVERTADGDVLKLKGGEIVEWPKGSYVYRAERTIVRERRPDEYPK